MYSSSGHTDLESRPAYADARVIKIAGGSIEIMKHIIGRSLFRRERAKTR
jgi:alkylation response protein AidB-like acyl-CoA dehydrogenase